MRIFLIAFLCASTPVVAQRSLLSLEEDTTATIDILPAPVLDEVEVFGTWASKNQPIAQFNLSEKQVQELNSGRDIPAVLGDLPNVVSFSDAGNGVGYTNMRVRGSDITRINVTVNGIPMNDAESHGVFWVNTPDLLSSTRAIQLQKGVGSSSNGSGAFGATLGLHTLGAGRTGGEVSVGAGSYGTQRYTAKLSTGLTRNGLWANARLSKITSDGYVDRASTDLQSYYLSGGMSGGGHYLEAVLFGGSERTYQAWWGIDSLTMYGAPGMAAAPTTNYAGALYDESWNTLGFYDNQVDQYGQEHRQLHYRYAYFLGGTLSLALHHTAGRGYFEEYNQNFGFADFGLPNYVNGTDTIAFGDVVSRKWLDNSFYGMTGSWIRENWDTHTHWVVGGGMHRYNGDHFGERIWANHPALSALDREFYRGDAVKDDANMYFKWTQRKYKGLLLYADAQYRYVRHFSQGGSATGPAFFDRTFHFFNPKAGLTKQLAKKTRWGAFVGVAHREPNRSDLQYALTPDAVQAERMVDAEVNYKREWDRIQIDLNGYYQYYQNQLVLTGELDNQGYAIRANVGQSYRRGVEAVAAASLGKRWSAQAHGAVSQNRNVDWVSPQHSDAQNTPIAFSPALLAGARLQYEWKGLEWSLYNTYVGSQYLSNEGLLAHSLPAYHLLNTRVHYTWSCDETQQIKVFLELRNLTNQSYAANGYVWDNEPYYYAQATFNVLSGLTFSF